ncbi:MAG: sigma-70 family RNA polymerase sigma factor [Phycisphaerae bacterium]|nr:sigma-70 family RNA polymerase sigma factor [Phycisphaerae bacterium]
MRRVVTKTSKSKRIAGWLHPPPYIMNREFKRRHIERELFEDWTDPPWMPGRIDPADEVRIFKQFHYCAYKLSVLYKTAVTSYRPSIHKEYARWVERYHSLRQRLIDANLGLVYDLIGRSRFSTLDRDEMVSEGMMALLRSVDTFDPWRGYRFSTYACNAILRAFSRAAMRDSRRRSLLTVPYDPEFEKSDLPRIRSEDREGLYVERLDSILRHNDAELTSVERSVLAKRFPEEHNDRMTLDRIGREMRVSKERVRQIQLSALNKLRRAIETDEVLSG